MSIALSLDVLPTPACEPKPDLARCSQCGWSGPAAGCETEEEGDHESGYYTVHLCPVCEGGGCVDDYSMSAELSVLWFDWYITHKIGVTVDRVHVRDRGMSVEAEYRIGPDVTCEAVAIKCPDGWIIDGIGTDPAWRMKGHAKAVLVRLAQLSGMPVLAMEIEPGAEAFWERMRRLGVCAPTP